MFMPLTSWKPPRTVLASPVLKSTRKLKLMYGLSRWVAIDCSYWVSGRGSGGRARGELADPEDDELGRACRRDTDLDDQTTVVEVVGGHRRGVAADEEPLLRLRAQECAGLPFGEQETLDGGPHRGPQRGSIDLEDNPLAAFVDRFLQVVEVPPHGEVLPLRILGDRACAPHLEARPGEEPEA